MELMVEFMKFAGIRDVIKMEKKSENPPLTGKLFCFLVNFHLQISGFSQVGKSFYFRFVGPNMSPNSLMGSTGPEFVEKTLGVESSKTNKFATESIYPPEV